MTSPTGPAQRIVNNLAHAMPYEAAVAWTHTAAVTRHAAVLGLIAEPGTIEAGIEAIASAHPRLAAFSDPIVNHMWTAPLAADQREQIAKLWATESVADGEHRPDGYVLGDLYQALSVESRKGRALCQTPQFVTELLLELAVDPACDEFGHDDIRIIDPSCGTGHILVETLLYIWSTRPQHSRARAHRWPLEERLPCVNGVDLDGYAAALAAYRLLALVCRADGRRWKLAEAADLPVNVAHADALLDRDEPLLRRGQYHAVVGNPPYITCKDPAARDAIRKAYPQVCSGTYSLALPFFHLMTELLVPGGWCAQLTANSFMKREFGKPFIEKYLPRLDMQWIIDTSGAYIPGHGTPTAILAHRNQPPTRETVPTVQGVKGEATKPENPARGLVWMDIAAKVQERLAFDRLARAVAPPAAEPPKPASIAIPPAVRADGQLDLFADMEVAA
jgi:hypothetical protein